MVLDQVTAFASTVGIGLLVGFLYDFYRVLGRVFRLKKTGTFLGDLLFSLLLTVFVFGLLLLINYGEVRFYVILGMVLGLLIYFHLLSNFSCRTISLFFSCVDKAFERIWRMTSFPFRVVFPAIARPLVLGRKGFRAILKRLWK